MDPGEAIDENQPSKQAPRTHDWDWVTVRREEPIRDFDVVHDSWDSFLSNLNDFQEVVFGKKCLALQNRENEDKIWGSLVNFQLCLTLRSNGPSIIRQGKETIDPATIDWTKTLQGVKAGAFKSCKTDTGATVYRGNLRGLEVEISTKDMSVLSTWSKANTNIPSIGDQQLELELRKAVLSSSKRLARKMADGYARFLYFNSALERSCKDLVSDISAGVDHPRTTDTPDANQLPITCDRGRNPSEALIDLTNQMSPKPLKQKATNQYVSNTGIEKPGPSTEGSMRARERNTESALLPGPMPVSSTDEEANLASSAECEQTPASQRSVHRDSPISEHRQTTEPIGDTDLDDNVTTAPEAPASRRSLTPISTKENQIKRNEIEKTQALSFVHNLLSEGLNFEQIRERYKAEFGIWRSVASLASYHSQNKRKLEPQNSTSRKKHHSDAQSKILSTSGGPLPTTTTSSSTQPSSSQPEGSCPQAYVFRNIVSGPVSQSTVPSGASAIPNPPPASDLHG